MSVLLVTGVPGIEVQALVESRAEQRPLSVDEVDAAVLDLQMGGRSGRWPSMARGVRDGRHATLGHDGFREVLTRRPGRVVAALGGPDGLRFLFVVRGLRRQLADAWAEHVLAGGTIGFADFVQAAAEAALAAPGRRRGFWAAQDVLAPLQALTSRLAPGAVELVVASPEPQRLSTLLAAATGGVPRPPVPSTPPPPPAHLEVARRVQVQLAAEDLHGTCRAPLSAALAADALAGRDPSSLPAGPAVDDLVHQFTDEVTTWVAEHTTRVWGDLADLHLPAGTKDWADVGEAMLAEAALDLAAVLVHHRSEGRDPGQDSA